MSQAYNSAMSYTSIAVIVVVICTQGMTSVLIASLFDDKGESVNVSYSTANGVNVTLSVQAPLPGRGAHPMQGPDAAYPKSNTA